MLPDKLPPLPRRARVLLLAAVGLIALLLVGPRLVDAYANWLWFGEVGFRSVWVTVLLTRVAIFVAVALVVGAPFFSGQSIGRIAGRGRSCATTKLTEDRRRRLSSRDPVAVAIDGVLGVFYRMRPRVAGQ